MSAEPGWPELKLEQLLTRLTAAGIDFVIVGGVARTLLGSPRITKDLDVCYATDPANLTALGEVLVALEARLRGVDEEVPFVPDERTLRNVTLLTLATRDGWLDILARPDGSPGYEALRRNAQRVKVESTTVLVASIDDLIAMKRASGRAQDLADIEELEAIKQQRRLEKRGGAS